MVKWGVLFAYKQIEVGAVSVNIRAFTNEGSGGGITQRAVIYKAHMFERYLHIYIHLGDYLYIMVSDWV